MKNKSVEELAVEFKRKYPKTIAWRVRKNARVVDKYLNPGEEPLFVFVGQKNHRFYDFFQTAVVALTNQRILIGRKRVVFGYFVNAVTPDMYNDLSISVGILWGRVIIDTVKEVMCFSNISKDALDEIKTNITSYMMSEKKKYKISQKP